MAEKLLKNRYLIEDVDRDELGASAFGTTYLARDTNYQCQTNTNRPASADALAKCITMIHMCKPALYKRLNCLISSSSGFLQLP
jgi:hypothetical protein